MHLMDIKLLSPSCWTDYELIDSGAFEKLERFGRYVIARAGAAGDMEQNRFPTVEWQQPGRMLISRRTRKARIGENGFASLKCHSNGS